MKPGARARLSALISRAAPALPRSPTAAILSPSIATSPTKRRAPVPSNIVACRIITSQDRAWGLATVEILQLGSDASSNRWAAPEHAPPRARHDMKFLSNSDMKLDQAFRQ